MKEKTKEGLQKEIEILRRKIAELDLREQYSKKGVSLQVGEQDYKSLTESLSELVYRADPETFEATYVNSAIERFYGYTEEEWLSHPRLWERSIHPEDRKRVLAEFRRAKRRSKNSVVRYRIIKKDKSLCWVEDHVSWEKDRRGKVISMDGVMYDITELKKIEEKLRENYEKLERENQKRNVELEKINKKLRKEIGERKQAEKALQESGRRWRLLLQNTPDIIITVDHGGRILAINRTVRGFTVEGTIGKKVYAFVDVRSRNILRRCLRYVFQTGKPTNYKVLGDGSEGPRSAWYETRVVPVEEKGKVIAATLISVDITERKKSLEIIEDRKERLSLAFERAKDAIFWADTKTGILINCNKAAEKLLEKDREEIIGKHQTIIHPPQKVKYYSRMFMDHIKDKGALDVEAEVITKSGKIKPVHITASLNQFKEGIVIQGIFRDITELKEKEKAIEASERKFKDLVETTTDWVWEVDKNARYTYSSPKVKELLGYEPDEVLGKTPFDFMTEEESRKLRKFFKEKIIKKELFYRLENINQHKDGHLVVLETSGIPLFDEKGEFKGYRGIDRDITGRRKAEKKLEIINQELIKANRRLKELILMDAQTGLYNHRYLTEVIEPEFQRAKRYEHPLSVVMIDIDYFKSINDVYGHKFGDMVLKQFAKVLKKTVRRYDIIIRYGGEEFLIISPGTDRTTALMLAGRIQEAIGLYKFGDGERIVEIKLSMAVASHPDDKAVEGMILIELADKILNKAKESGGNRIYSSSDISTEKPAETVKTEDLAEVKFLREKIEKLNKKANQSLIEAIFAFVKTIKLKDSYTGEHVERMVHYSTEIANALNLTKDEIDDIRQASVLHDLGKIGIGERILLKSKKLNRREFDLIKKHPQIGVDIIRPIHYLHSIIPIILYHHEKWNGEGYPKGLKGEEIPIGARIVAVADVYQALISDRPYRKAYSKQEAIEIIKSGAGVHFDPKIVDIFLHVLKK